MALIFDIVDILFFFVKLPILPLPGWLECLDMTRYEISFAKPLLQGYR